MTRRLAPSFRPATRAPPFRPGGTRVPAAPRRPTRSRPHRKPDRRSWPAAGSAEARSTPPPTTTACWQGTAPCRRSSRARSRAPRTARTPPPSSCPPRTPAGIRYVACASRTNGLLRVRCLTRPSIQQWLQGLFEDEVKQHLRTTNVIESPFAALRLRTDAANRCKKVANATAVIWKMPLLAETKFRSRTPRRSSHRRASGAGRCLTRLHTY